MEYKNTIFHYCLLVMIFVLPIFVIPFVGVSLNSAKFLFMASISVVFMGAFMIYTLKNHIVRLPRLGFLIPLIIFPLVAVVSSFMTGSIIKSIAGQSFELGTSGSFVLLTLLVFIAIIAVQKNVETGIKALYVFLLSGVVVFAHLILRIFGAYIPEMFATRIPNFIVGGAIDTSIFLGGVIIASICALNFLTISNRIKYLIYALIVASMLFLGAVGLSPLIIVLGLFSLVYFVYGISWKVSEGAPDNFKMSINVLPTLFVLVFSIIFILSGSVLSGYISNVFKVNVIEVRPDFGATLHVVKESWSQNFLLGVGPNKFADAWNKFKPVDVNMTQFWAVDFDFGSGFLPTIASTTGFLGFAVFMIFIVMYTLVGLKAIFINTEELKWRYITSTSFFVSLFFWLATIIYSPSIVILALTFIFSGIFAASLTSLNIAKEIEINVFKNPKTNFATVFVIVALLIVSIAMGYFVWERTVAASIFGKGVTALRAGDSETARMKMGGAINLVPTDTYWRGFAEASMVNFGQITSSIASAENLTEMERVNIQSAISDSIESARQAIAWDPTNYRNWFTLGQVYENFAATGIAGALESGREAYNEALSRSTNNPAIYLAFARLDALLGNLDEAKQNIDKALELKSNYTDAYFTLAQLEVASNNIPGAIRGVEATTVLDPNNAGLFFQLGLLKYNTRDFIGSSKSFERAIELVSDYANARYFLGLSYYNLSREEDAIVQFEEIKKSNPENTEVDLILKNLKAGRDPFVNAKPPVDDKPEKREKLPIEEN